MNAAFASHSITIASAIAGMNSYCPVFYKSHVNTPAGHFLSHNNSPLKIDVNITRKNLRNLWLILSLNSGKKQVEVPLLN
jgi:hypothetical protein